MFIEIKEKKLSGMIIDEDEENKEKENLDLSHVLEESNIILFNFKFQKLKTLQL